MTEWVRLTSGETGRSISIRVNSICAVEDNVDDRNGSCVYFGSLVLVVRETYEEVRQLMGIK